MGGSFLGSFSIYKWDWNHTKAIEYFTRYDLDEVFFTRGMSANFTREVEDRFNAGLVTYSRQMGAYGGAPVPSANNKSPYEMGRYFEEWRTILNNFP